ncbi:MAG TPA: DUF6542 domain-containing protein [Mycobacteriales bacterium]|nr:DUF6542 domain-containing protein [Mycobacteriales bacterium]
MTTRSVQAGRAGRGAAASLGATAGPSLTDLGAVLVIVATSMVGGCIDLITGSGLRLAFAVGLVFGAAVAAAIVRRSGLLTVVVAPPLIYVLASLISVLVAPGGLGAAGKLYDAAAGWLVYGFPAMASATGIAVVVAGIRLAGSSRA